MWLRLLGRGNLQKNAIQELEQLPLNDPHRDNVIELVYELFAMLEANQRNKINIKEDKILMTSLREIFRERLAQEAEKAAQEGHQ